MRYRLLPNLVFFGSDGGVPGVLWLPELPKLPADIVTSVSLLLFRTSMLSVLLDSLSELRSKMCGPFLIII